MMLFGKMFEWWEISNVPTDEMDTDQPAPVPTCEDPGPVLFVDKPGLSTTASADSVTASQTQVLSSIQARSQKKMLARYPQNKQKVYSQKQQICSLAPVSSSPQKLISKEKEASECKTNPATVAENAKVKNTGDDMVKPQKNDNDTTVDTVVDIDTTEESDSNMGGTPATSREDSEAEVQNKTFACDASDVHAFDKQRFSRVMGTSVASSDKHATEGKQQSPLHSDNDDENDGSRSEAADEEEVLSLYVPVTITDCSEYHEVSISRSDSFLSAIEEEEEEEVSEQTSSGESTDSPFEGNPIAAAAVDGKTRSGTLSKCQLESEARENNYGAVAPPQKDETKTYADTTHPAVVLTTQKNETMKPAPSQDKVIVGSDCVSNPVQSEGSVFEIPNEKASGIDKEKVTIANYHPVNGEGNLEMEKPFQMQNESPVLAKGDNAAAAALALQYGSSGGDKNGLRHRAGVQNQETRGISTKNLNVGTKNLDVGTKKSASVASHLGDDKQTDNKETEKASTGKAPATCANTNQAQLPTNDRKKEPKACELGGGDKQTDKYIANSFDKTAKYIEASQKNAKGPKTDKKSEKRFTASDPAISAKQALLYSSDQEERETSELGDDQTGKDIAVDKFNIFELEKAQGSDRDGPIIATKQDLSSTNAQKELEVDVEDEEESITAADDLQVLEQFVTSLEKQPTADEESTLCGQTNAFFLVTTIQLDNTQTYNDEEAAQETGATTVEEQAVFSRPAATTNDGKIGEQGQFMAPLSEEKPQLQSSWWFSCDPSNFCQIGHAVSFSTETVATDNDDNLPTIVVCEADGDKFPKAACDDGSLSESAQTEKVIEESPAGDEHQRLLRIGRNDEIWDEAFVESGEESQSSKLGSSNPFIWDGRKVANVEKDRGHVQTLADVENEEAARRPQLEKVNSVVLLDDGSEAEPAKVVQPQQLDAASSTGNGRKNTSVQKDETRYYKDVECGPTTGENTMSTGKLSTEIVEKSDTTTDLEAQGFNKTTASDGSLQEPYFSEVKSNTTDTHTEWYSSLLSMFDVAAPACAGIVYPDQTQTTEPDKQNQKELTTSKFVDKVNTVSVEQFRGNSKIYKPVARSLNLEEVRQQNQKELTTSKFIHEVNTSVEQFRSNSNSNIYEPVARPLNLEVWSCRVSRSDAEALIAKAKRALLFSPFSKVELNLHCCDFKDDGEAFQFLVDHAHKLPVEQLCLLLTNLTHDEIAELLYAVSASCRRFKMSLKGTPGATKVFEQCYAIEHLSLSPGWSDDINLKELSVALPEMKSIKILEIVDCAYKDDTFEDLVDALLDESVLRRLEKLCLHNRGGLTGKSLSTVMRLVQVLFLPNSKTQKHISLDFSLRNSPKLFRKVNQYQVDQIITIIDQRPMLERFELINVGFLGQHLEEINFAQQDLKLRRQEECPTK